MSAQLNLYERLADELGTLIASKVLAPGERLPSIRHLSQQKRLSISTVMQALRLLEDRGLIDARPQAGFYVRHRARSLSVVADTQALNEPTHVFGINNLLAQVLHAHKAPDVVDLGLSCPREELLPIRRIQQLIGSVARRRPELLTMDGCFDTNEPGFVRQVTRRAIDWGRISPQEIIVTNSCTEAISLCLRAVAKPGDTIAIESPIYFVLLQLIESLGMKALEIPTDPKTGLSIDALELAMREGLVQACLMVPNVNNPLGCIMPDASKKRLASLLGQYGIPLIEDDIYSDLCFAERPWPVKAYDTGGNVMLCSSFSKVISPSARVGYVLAGKYAQQVAFLKNVSSGGTNHFLQAVLAEYIGSNGYDVQVRKMRRAVAQRVAQMSDAIAEHFPAECSVSTPQGGFVLWVQLPESVDTLALHKRALQHKIAFMPGSLFSASGKYRNCLRLNCGNLWSPEIENAVKTLGGLAHEQAS